MTPSDVDFSHITVAGKRRRFVNLRRVLGEDLERLPFVLRLLAENHLRNGGQRAGLAKTLFGPPDRGIELLFQPNRLLMHDTTATPALTDVAALRDVVAEAGGDPARLSPTIPVHVSVDHSLAVNAFARADASAINLRNEIRRNRERYAFLKWASAALGNLTVFPPGTGIMHTINLEQLSTLLCVDARGITHPDMMLGTDSHTPMVNGVGVLAWGVGGLEAEAIMFGEPASLTRPEVVGVRLTGRLGPGAFSTDIALTVTALLREAGVTGSFVEFFGPGVASLSAGDRAVIANMAPEYGATTGYFPIDDETIGYLRSMGRPSTTLEAANAVLRAQGLWFDPTTDPSYERVVELDLSGIAPLIAGPQRPQDKRRVAEAQRAVEAAIGRDLAPTQADAIPDGAVGIAAITSCTNTSDPKLIVAAGLLARAARRLGLRPPPWVKTSLAPGSPSMRALLSRAGLLDDLAWMGFDIVGFGCTTCIGNSGDLLEEIEEALEGGSAVAAILSGNRNFPGRVHPKLSLGFLASPPLVVAYAIRGDIRGDIEREPLGRDKSGAPVHLADLWPSSTDVDKTVSTAFRTEDAGSAFERARENKAWSEIACPATLRFPWSETSKILRRPVFVGSGAETPSFPLRAKPLLSLGDDVTTDHISPAGAIEPSSLAGKWLIERGADPSDLNVYASYRGNWEVMLRGMFTNRSLVNRLAPDLVPGTTICPITGQIVSLLEAAETCRGHGQPSVIFAGERYGAGSSRDWAAKGVALLGVRAVIARSVERIHRTNLIAMGVSPIELVGPHDFDPSDVTPQTSFSLSLKEAELTPRARLQVLIETKGNRAVLEAVLAANTLREVSGLADGGLLGKIISSTLFDSER